MAIFKCKMCGEQLEFTKESTYKCKYCSSEQTLPHVMDENLEGLFICANDFRMEDQFDKAADMYEKILQIDDTVAEAYWGLVLCKYGIKYVEDRATYKRVPTCSRLFNALVTEDDDYKKAISYSDVRQRRIYEAEARAIDIKNKGLLSKEKSEKRTRNIIIAVLILFVVFILGKGLLDKNLEKNLEKKRLNDELDNLRTASVGDTVEFSDCDWIILDKKDNCILVISEGVFYRDSRGKLSSRNGETWENSDIRYYLNGDFYRSFNSDERRRIVTTKIKTNDNPQYGTDGGADTDDKIFLLSLDEVDRYFKDAEARKSYHLYLLRTPGESKGSFVFVSENGWVDYGGYIFDGYGNIRPAMWINIE